jgi:3-phytase
MSTRSVGPMLTKFGACAFALVAAVRCGQGIDDASASSAPLEPVLVSERVDDDSDDPAIWIDPSDPARSLVIGTDKGGALFAFDLSGKRVADRTVRGLERPNNVDVEYGLRWGEGSIDIAACTERDAGRMRVFRMPSLEPIDGGGIELFAGEPDRRPMGIALYRRPTDDAVFAIVARKDGPDGGLLWQYRIEAAGADAVRATRVRAFGHWRGPQPDASGDATNEVEALFVDDALGFVYYAEESHGIHKYAADPDAKDAATELAFFGTSGFVGDREGISLLATGAAAGYLLVSDQQARRFRVFSREGEPGAPHTHREIATFDVRANESDGSECVTTALGSRFGRGLFVAMSDDRSFHFYDAGAVRDRVEATRTAAR